MNNLENLELAQDDDLFEADNQYWVDQAEALDRLMTNPDFEKVILTGYFKDRAVDQVSLLANDSIVRNNLRPQVMETLVAISHLQDYFGTIRAMATSFNDFEEEEEDS